MAYLSETATYEEGVRQLERTDPVDAGVGGDGVANTPLKHLANRTKYLKACCDAIGLTPDSTLDDILDFESLENQITLGVILDANNHRIINVADPTENGDAINRGWALENLGYTPTVVTTPILSGGANATINTGTTFKAFGSTTNDENAVGTITYRFWATACKSITQVDGSTVSILFPDYTNGTTQFVYCYAQDDLGNMSNIAFLQVNLITVLPPQGVIIHVPDQLVADDAIHTQLDVTVTTPNDNILYYYWEYSYDSGVTWNTDRFSNYRIYNPEFEWVSGDATSGILIRVTVSNSKATASPVTSHAVNAVAIGDVTAFYDDDTVRTVTPTDYTVTWTVTAKTFTVTGDIFEVGDFVMFEGIIDTVASESYADGTQTVALTNLDGTNGATGTVTRLTKYYDVPQQTNDENWDDLDIVVNFQADATQALSVTKTAVRQVEYICTDQARYPFQTDDNVFVFGSTNSLNSIHSIFSERISDDDGHNENPDDEVVVIVDNHRSIDEDAAIVWLTNTQGVVISNRISTTNTSIREIYILPFYMPGGGVTFYPDKALTASCKSSVVASGWSITTIGKDCAFVKDDGTRFRIFFSAKLDGSGIIYGDAYCVIWSALCSFNTTSYAVEALRASTIFATGATSGDRVALVKHTNLIASLLYCNYSQSSPTTDIKAYQVITDWGNNDMTPSTVHTTVANIYSTQPFAVCGLNVTNAYQLLVAYVIPSGITGLTPGIRVKVITAPMALNQPFVVGSAYHISDTLTPKFLQFTPIDSEYALLNYTSGKVAITEDPYGKVVMIKGTADRTLTYGTPVTFSTGEVSFAYSITGVGSANNVQIIHAISGGNLYQTTGTLSTGAMSLTLNPAKLTSNGVILSLHASANPPKTFILATFTASGDTNTNQKTFRTISQNGYKYRTVIDFHSDLPTTVTKIQSIQYSLKADLHSTTPTYVSETESYAIKSGTVDIVQVTAAHTSDSGTKANVQVRVDMTDTLPKTIHDIHLRLEDAA